MCFVKRLANSILTYVPNMIHICPNKIKLEKLKVQNLKNYLSFILLFYVFVCTWISLLISLQKKKKRLTYLINKIFLFIIIKILNKQNKKPYRCIYHLHTPYLALILILTSCFVIESSTPTYHSFQPWILLAVNFFYFTYVGFSY